MNHPQISQRSADEQKSSPICGHLRNLWMIFDRADFASTIYNCENKMPIRNFFVARVAYPLMLVLIATLTWNVVSQSVMAREPDHLLFLWPDGAPGAKGTADGDRPEISVYLAAGEKNTRAGVVVCPGGGYGHLAVDHEGKQIAEWFNSIGVSAFVLKYRHRASGAGYGHPAPLDDAQRAIRLVRSKAADWKVDAKRIGIMGFSAGGHLASTAATHFDDGKADAKDPIDKQGCRPDFAILCYAVITFDDAHTHQGSKKNLLGADPDKKLVESLSNEKQVTEKTPPTFLWSTGDDAAVPVENSVLFYLACRKAKVPAELHVYEHGPHGVGLAKDLPGVSVWSEQLAAWLKHRGVLAGAGG
jgi:acetyl esterase/lipase